MAIFVFIGGGENGRPGTKYETQEIDKTIVNLSLKNNPNLLFMAHGTDQEEQYFDIIKKNFGFNLNCNCEILKKQELDFADIVIQKLDKADIIYIGGGNTQGMLELWKGKKFIDVLQSYSKSNKIICGISAGAICWCQYGLSDSKIITGESDEYIIVNGMNVINILFCPSYKIEKEKYILKYIDGLGIIGIALEACTALIIDNGKYKAIRSNTKGKIYKYYCRDEEYTREEIVFDDKYNNVENLNDY